MGKQYLWFVGVSFLLAGCIGTDLVDDPPLDDARIDITPATTALQQGDTLRFQAAFYDIFGVHVPDITFSWESSDTRIAAVDAAGLVMGEQVGQVHITALAEGVASMPALLTVVGDPNQVAQVVVEPDTLSLSLGESHTFTASALNLDGAPLSGKQFTWSSSNPEVVTVDADGRVTALVSGIAGITATTEGVASVPALLIVPGRNRQGTFVKRPGTAYNLAGTATLEEQPDGTLLLKLEDDFMSSAGPGLEVILSTTNVVNSGSLSLGDLQQTTGAQTYEVSSSVELETYDWVIIHCVPFNVTFGYAELQ